MSRSARAILLLVLSAAPAVADPPTRDDRRCIDRLHRAAVGVAVARAARAVRCVEQATRGALPAGQHPSDYLADIDGGPVGHALARTRATEGRHCEAAPPFGPAGADAINTAVLQISLGSELFGAAVDMALAPGNRARARCQVAVTRAAAALDVLRLRGFTACVRNGLASGIITDATGLHTCSAADPGPGARRLSAKLARTAATRCRGVDVAAAFPGRCADASVDTLGACVADASACATCRIVNGIDGIVRGCHTFAEGVATAFCGDRPPRIHSVARQWDDEALEAIKIDFPRPPIHARNLFHLSVAMWDAWAAFDPVPAGYLHVEKMSSSDVARDRAIAVSFAAYRLLAARYAGSPNAPTSATALARRMYDLGYDVAFTTTDGPTPAALGNRVAAAVLAHGATDGANEAANYADPTYTPVNSPLVVKTPGTVMADPNRWQPLALDVQIGQNGIPIPGKIQTFVGSQWGSVLAFVASLPALLPPPPPRLHDPATDAAFKQAAVDVLRTASQLTPDDGALIDVSPASLGNNPLGTNDGTGYATNPVTGQAYVPQMVRRGDFGRVLAEYWADGPNSETPPGHWNALANYVSDQPSLARRIGGSGPVVDDLEWDVKLYLALNGALHDAAIGCWGTKRIYDSVRPISMIRYMGGLGQSSDPLGPSHHPDGLPLVPNLIEVITPASSMPGERHAALAEHVGEIAVYAWPGEPADPRTQYSGVRWTRATTWLPYQRNTFVTPPFAAYTSGHSTYSRAAAEVLTALTGSAFFPGGLGEYAVPQNAFLRFEIGPSTPLVLQWATYYDAADQAGQSRIWGGIHILPDDFGGRVMGSTIGHDAWMRARDYFTGAAVP